MKRSIAFAARPEGAWAALAEDGAIVELRPPQAASGVGDIYLGHVVALRPDLPAALVDLGFARPAFLSAEDVRPRGGFAGLHEGQAVIVQIVKDARADKAAGVTMRLAAKLPSVPPDAKPPLKLNVAPGAGAPIAAWLDPAPVEILADDRAAYAELRHWLMARHPGLVEKLKFANELLFERFGLGEALDAALARRVELPGGGTLIVEPTALGVAIDVDSGNAKALDANLAATRAVARHIRLRNLAGPIVIGFIGLKGKGERGRVLAVLKQALARHAPDCQMLGWTRLGHFELVRKRRAPSLGEILGVDR